MPGHTSLAVERLGHDHPAFVKVARAERTAESAAGFTGQLLAYSGREKFEVRPLNVSKLVLDAICLLHVLAPNNVKIVQELSRNFC